MVEKVERFGTEVDTLCLGKMPELQRERLAERKIECRDAGVAKNVTAGSAERSGSIESERSGVKPFAQLCRFRAVTGEMGITDRSEERRVGKECGSRWSAG